MRIKSLLLSAVCVTGSVILLIYSFKPRTPKIQFNHFALHVNDFRASKEFYSNIVGLDSIPEPFKDGKHAWYQISEHGQLHIIAGALKTIHDKNTHLCLSVGSINNFIQQLQKHHISFENWTGDMNAVTTRADGVHQIYIQDPDGYWIEINDDQF